MGNGRSRDQIGNIIIDYLAMLYGEDVAGNTWKRLKPVLDDFKVEYSRSYRNEKINDEYWSEKDIILITYGDQFQAANTAPLQSLKKFLDKYLNHAISGVHILPFYRYSSDDGFAVTNYRQVDPKFGSWDDIRALRREYKLMFDAVINHVSSGHEWFQSYLKVQAPYINYFISIGPNEDLSQVYRPRASSVTTNFMTDKGLQAVWTTFSDDQVDLNFTNPDVLLEIVDLLLFYIRQGANLIRLDAIPYLWKTVGTNSIHLPQTHIIVKIFRAILDLVAPDILLITEANESQGKNFQYFGKPVPNTTCYDEAQLVYQFALPPLLIHTFTSGNSEKLTRWAIDMTAPSRHTSFFNLIASHDGIGMRPATGILTQTEIEALADRCIKHGGKIAYITDAEGNQLPYELNISLYDILNDPGDCGTETGIVKFLAAQVIMLSLTGIPGIYVHSLFGTSNDYIGFKKTGQPRSLNRKKFQLKKLQELLEDNNSIQNRIFFSYRQILHLRRKYSAFHPSGRQIILNLGNSNFSLLRESPDKKEAILCLVNITAYPQKVVINDIQTQCSLSDPLIDLIKQETYQPEDGEILVRPYDSCWFLLKN
ncbi:MAG: sugar phosphorylase [Candidatus Marinimicrobia bacterium]|nr:sugar phosphorylase [Candidatus Neomarinimicrobiota bacterium]